MVTHDPNAASYADVVCFLADGRGVDTLAHPDAAQVSARMSRWSAPQGAVRHVRLISPTRSHAAAGWR